MEETSSDETGISEIVNSSFLAPDEVYRKLKRQNRSTILKYSGNTILDVLLNLIPTFGGALANLKDKGLSYRDSQLFRKFASYVYEVGDISYKDREKFISDLERTAEDYHGDILSGMIDRLDNINKTVILANLTKSRVNGNITIEDFFRLANILEKIPYTDFNYLSDFTESKYLDGGVTELLYSVGVLVQTSIDSDQSNKYSLSINGLKLLKYGLLVEIDKKIENKTEVDSLKWDYLE